MNIDDFDDLQEQAERKVGDWLESCMRAWVEPEVQRDMLQTYMKLSDSARKLLSSKHRQEMEELRRRWS